MEFLTQNGLLLLGLTALAVAALFGMCCLAINRDSREWEKLDARARQLEENQEEMDA